MENLSDAATKVVACRLTREAYEKLIQKAQPRDNQSDVIRRAIEEYIEDVPDPS
jgi:predicted DNA-binding protein